MEYVKTIFVILLLMVIFQSGTTGGLGDYSYENLKSNDLKDFMNEHVGLEILSSVPRIKPVDGVITSKMGFRNHPILKIRKFHKGIDISAKSGTKVRSTSFGTVFKVHYSNTGYGNSIWIKSGDYIIKYCHLKKILKKEGELVEEGETIAEVGSTGLSTAPHLHYEIFYKNELQNPTAFIF